VTLGGIHGTIVGMEDKTLLIQVTDAVKLKFDKSAVSSVTRG
ncbi:MAG: preprotein translocase subunit YajC, partial [Bacteroidota bacterium]